MTATVISLMKHQRRYPTQPAQRAADQALKAELRRARIRITQLEASLAEALRDNLLHHERAREAERRLEELLALSSGTPDSGPEPN